MKTKVFPSDKESRRRRRERSLIAITLILLGVFTYLEVHFLNWGLEGQRFNSLFFFALINLNSILLLLLIFLVVRNLVKLFLERKRKAPGAQIKTRLVTGFVGLSLMPTLFLFIISLQFISTSVEQWFNLNVEKSLQESLELGKIYYQRVLTDLEEKGSILEKEILDLGLGDFPEPEKLKKLLERKGREWNLTLAGVYAEDNNKKPVRFCIDGFTSTAPLPEFRETLDKAMNTGGSIKEVRSLSTGDAAFLFLPIKSLEGKKEGRGVLVLISPIPRQVVERMSGISKGYDEYQQIRMLQNPIKITHYITLSIITLLILFFATWFGFYLAKGITGPLQAMVEATHSIATGNYDIHIDAEAQDEIGNLVESFNRMAADLKQGKAELDLTNRKLVQRNEEIEQRRRYMEVVLENVATGVISVDAEGRISTINRSAENILNISAKDLVDKHYKEVLPSSYQPVVEEFMEELNRTKSGSVSKTIKLALGDETKTLMVNFNELRDEDNRYMGMVVVLDDLSHIEKVQRMTAWREVARRIAHEVKNPLTPIQLSAQRLHRRYRRQIKEDDKVFDECTSTIVTQVDELKRLVDEFSNFARMPAVNPSPNDLNQIIEETLLLYRQAHRDILFSFHRDKEIPMVNLDREQIKRAFINLLDNAVDAVGRENGEVVLSSSHDPVLNVVRVEVADNGVGISPENKLRLFEPYFSTKKSGTGLGLAIVSTIIADHNGYIRVQDNKPRGTRFIIELPVRT
jgi:two-component system nitrogen regulation sensor histidine kinase NtrY